MKIFIRWVVRIIGFAIIFFLIVGAGVYFVFKPSTPPDIKDAPWVIQTYSNDELRIPSRIYYASKIEMRDGVPVAITYWSFDGEKYHKHEGEQSFPLSEYGNIKIVRR